MGATRRRWTGGSRRVCRHRRRRPLEGLLVAWERESTDEVLDGIEREGGDPRTEITRAGRLTFSDDRLLPIDLAVRDWARRDEAVAARLRRVDDRRMTLLPEMIGTVCSDPDQLEVRSLLAFYLAIEEHFLAANHGHRTRAQVLARAVHLLQDRTGPRLHGRWLIGEPVRTSWCGQAPQRIPGRTGDA